jgi:hypothetical protein
MTIKTRACVRCHGATHLAQLERISGTERFLAVTVHDLPVLACEQGHVQFVRADFPVQLLEQIIGRDELQLPAGRAKGLLFKHYHCGACGAQLDANADHNHTIALSVRVPDLPPFRCDLTLPLFRCGGCGTQQLQTAQAVQDLVPVALAHAFQAARLPHA